MTDNNTDETDGLGTNISRRTALTALGVSTLGGAAATSAFSKLTADRPIDLEVVNSGGDSEVGADNTTSTLKITNNANEDIDVNITSSVSENITFVDLTGPNTANIAKTNQSWELTGLNSSGTAEIQFDHDTTNTSVDFNAEAFSSTDGFSIGSDQAVDVLDNLLYVLSKEEDGDLTEWSGSTSFYTTDTVTTHPTSNYSISYGTGGTPQYVDTSFTQTQYEEYRFYIYPEDSNNEVTFYDASGSTTDVTFCIYHRDRSNANDGMIYYSSPDNNTDNPLDNVGSLGNRNNGEPLTSSGSRQWYEIRIQPDWNNNVADVYLDNSKVLSNVTFAVDNTVPDTLRLMSNNGSPTTSGYVDEVVGLNTKTI